MVLAYKYWLDTVKYDTERMEGIVYAMEHMMNSGLHVIVNMLYHKYKNYKGCPANKLFIYKTYYNHHIEFYNSISAFYVGDYVSGYECAKKNSHRKHYRRIKIQTVFEQPRLLQKPMRN